MSKCLSSLDNGSRFFLTTTIFTPLHQLKVQLKLFIWLYRRFTSCLFVSRYYYRKVISWTADVSQRLRNYVSDYHTETNVLCYC